MHSTLEPTTSTNDYGLEEEAVEEERRSEGAKLEAAASGIGNRHQYLSSGDEEHVLTDLDAMPHPSHSLAQSFSQPGPSHEQPHSQAGDEQLERALSPPSEMVSLPSAQTVRRVRQEQDGTKMNQQQQQLMQQSYIKQEVYEIDKTIQQFWPAKKKRFCDYSDTDIREIGRKMELPMARVKKIMKIDDDVRQMMISSDAPAFLAMACELFVEELTLLSWQIVEDGRRKTMQRSDVSYSVAFHEHLDFLVDIVPREEKKYIPSFMINQNKQQQQQQQQQEQQQTQQSSQRTVQGFSQPQSQPPLPQAVVLTSNSGSSLLQLSTENGFLPVSVSAPSSNTHHIVHLNGALPQDGLQYVIADVSALNDEEWQLDNGVTVHATQIGQPFPIDGADGNTTIQMLPPNVQIIQVPAEAITANGHIQLQTTNGT